MAKFNRGYVIQDAVQSSDSTTLDIKLPTSGMLSALVLRARATNGSTSNVDNPIMDTISKIEIVVNGSKVIRSITGADAVRLGWLLLGKRPQCLISEQADAVQFDTFPIMFGRYIGDPEFGLNLVKYTDPTLRITYNLAANRAVSATTAFTTGSMTFDIIEWRASKNSGLAPRGFVQMRQATSFTSVASGEKEIDLLRGEKLLGVAITAYERGVDDNTNITTVQLDVDDEERIITKSDWNDLQEENARMFNVNPDVVVRAFRADNEAVETFTGTIQEAIVEGQVDQGAGQNMVLVQAASYSGGTIPISSVIFDSATGAAAVSLNTTRQNLTIHSRGVGVGNLAYVDLDPWHTFQDFLDTSTVSKATLTLTQGNAGATVHVITLELVSN